MSTFFPSFLLNAYIHRFYLIFIPLCVFFFCFFLSWGEQVQSRLVGTCVIEHQSQRLKQLGWSNKFLFLIVVFYLHLNIFFTFFKFFCIFRLLCWCLSSLSLSLSLSHWNLVYTFFTFFLNFFLFFNFLLLTLSLSFLLFSLIPFLFLSLLFFFLEICVCF